MSHTEKQKKEIELTELKIFTDVFGDISNFNGNESATAVCFDAEDIRKAMIKQLKSLCNG